MATADVNGHRLFFEEGGSGPALVMLHGSIAGSAQTLAAHIPDLSRDFRVIVPDLRGLGGSARVADMPARGWVDDVSGVLDALGVDRAHVYGGAMGSRVAMRVATDHPARVRSLVLDWTIMRNIPEADARIARMFGPDAEPPQAEMLRRDHGDDWREVARFYHRLRGSEEFARYYDPAGELQRIAAPALIVRGDIDDEQGEVHPLAHSIEAHAGIPRSWLAVFPNTRGNLSLARPEEFRALLREFVGWVGEQE